MQFLIQDLKMNQVLEWSKEKLYRMSAGKFPHIQIQLVDPLLHRQNCLYQKFLEAFDPEINMDFEEKSPFQEGMISEIYQRPDKSYFQKPQELDSLINTSRLGQKFLSKQADINKIFKIIQRKVLKGMHLPVTVKNTGKIFNQPIF